jgi:hypothetical protein
MGMGIDDSQVLINFPICGRFRRGLGAGSNQPPESPGYTG